MMDTQNITAQEYVGWLVQTMAEVPEGPELNKLQREFNAIKDQLVHLHTCYEMEPYEPERGI